MAKAAPGKYNYSQTSSSSRLVAELFKSRAGSLDIVAVPYKGLAPARQDVQGGGIQMVPAVPDAAMKYHQEGLLQILAAFSDECLASVRDVPAALESGVPNLHSALRRSPINTGVGDAIHHGARQGSDPTDRRDATQGLTTGNAFGD